MKAQASHDQASFKTQDFGDVLSSSFQDNIANRAERMQFFKSKSESDPNPIQIRSESNSNPIRIWSESDPNPQS